MIFQQHNTFMQRGLCKKVSRLGVAMTCTRLCCACVVGEIEIRFLVGEVLVADTTHVLAADKYEACKNIDFLAKLCKKQSVSSRSCAKPLMSLRSCAKPLFSLRLCAKLWFSLRLCAQPLFSSRLCAKPWFSLHLGGFPR